MDYSYDEGGNVVARAVGASLAPRITGQPVKEVVGPGEIVL
jgi:hypothetical protein